MKSIVSHIRQSLSMKLSFGILLLAVPIFVVVMGALFLQSRYIIKREALGRATSALNATTQRVKRYLGTVETATNSTDWLVTANFHPDSLLAYSRRIVMLNANVNGCSITAQPDMFPQLGRYFSAYSVRQGDSVVTVREAPYEYFDKVWYKTPMQAGEACWVDPFDDFNEGTLSASDMIASYCKPLYIHKQFVGVISTDLSLPRLAEALDTEKPYTNAYFLMLGKDGHYFIHPDTARLVSETIFSIADARSHPDVIALGHEMTSGNQGSMRIIIDGAPCQVCYQPVPGTQWSLALVCPDRDILSSYYRLTYVIVPLLLLGLLLILLLCRRIAAHASRPLNRLLTQSQRIAEGHYGERIPHSRRGDAVGQLQNIFATMQESLDRHISDIRRVNRETEQRNEELQQARLMAEEAGRQKTAFIQNMTHQIRTPLNIIMGFAQVLRDTVKDLPEGEVKSITDMMEHNAGSLNRMVLMLYDSSETGLTEELANRQLETVSCNEVARESIATTHQHNPELTVNFETSLPDSFVVQTNRLYLARCLLEILCNSAKYSDGQNVSMCVSATETTVRFIFSDTGPGISADYQDLMFDFFTKVNDLSEGLGLGLPLTKRHARNLGGDLILDASYHEGCRFILELPV